MNAWYVTWFIKHFSLEPTNCSYGISHQGQIELKFGENWIGNFLLQYLKNQHSFCSPFSVEKIVGLPFLALVIWNSFPQWRASFVAPLQQQHPIQVETQTLGRKSRGVWGCNTPQSFRNQDWQGNPEYKYSVMWRDNLNKIFKNGLEKYSLCSEKYYMSDEISASMFPMACQPPTQTEETIDQQKEINNSE